MIADMLRELAEATLASSAAIVVVLAARRHLRALAGAGVAYAAWAAVPLAALAVWMPARVAVPGVAVAPAFAAIGDAIATPASVDFAPWLLALWAIGAGATATVFAIRQRRFRAALLPLADAPYLASPDGGPAVFGLLRPRIVLPLGYEEHYTPGELALVLAHERLHVQRGDLFAQAVSSLLRCLFWFNPLLPAAEHLFRDDQEMACDAAVLRRHPESRRSYGAAMLKTHLADTGLPLGCHWQSGHSLKERISMLKQPVPGTFRRRSVGSLVAVSLLATAAMAWAAQPATTATASSDATTSTPPATAPAADSPNHLHAVTDADVLTAPPYPAGLAAEGVGGQVMLDVLVGEDGVPVEVKVVSATPPGVFDAVAVEAARKWRFNAGRNGAAGEKVEGWVRIPVQFSPDGPES